LMDNYTGIYTDISFVGFADWSIQLASNNIEHYRAFVNKYHERVMFGTDMVVTNNVRKTVSWIANLTMGYRDMLEKSLFHINVPNITGEGFDFDMDLNGFGLSQDKLDKIYFDNALRFLKGRPVTEDQNQSGSRSNRHKDNNDPIISLKTIIQSSKLVNPSILILMSGICVKKIRNFKGSNHQCLAI